MNATDLTTNLPYPESVKNIYPEAKSVAKPDLTMHMPFLDLGRDLAPEMPDLAQPKAVRPQSKPNLDRLETAYFTPQNSPRLAPESIALPVSALSAPKSSRPSSPMLSPEHIALPESILSTPAASRPSSPVVEAPKSYPSASNLPPLGAPIVVIAARSKSSVSSESVSGSTTPAETPIVVTPVESATTTRVSTPAPEAKKTQSVPVAKTEPKAERKTQAAPEATTEAKPQVVEPRLGKRASMKNFAAKTYARVAVAMAAMVAGLKGGAAYCESYIKLASIELASSFKKMGAKAKAAYVRSVAGIKSGVAFRVKHAKVVGNKFVAAYKRSVAKFKAGIARVKTIFTKKPMVEIKTPKVEIKVETPKA